MSGNRVYRVASVGAELDPQALAAGDLVPFHPAEELGGLACEHGTNNQLNVALEFWQGVMLGAVRAAVEHLLVMRLLWRGPGCA
jgi:hypothetical protein